MGGDTGKKNLVIPWTFPENGNVKRDYETFEDRPGWGLESVRGRQKHRDPSAGG